MFPVPLEPRQRALLSLLLLIPAPSIGIVCASILFPDTFLGQALFFSMKLWLLGLPLVWHLYVDTRRPSLSPPRTGGFGFGIGSGLIISAIVILVYALLGDRLIDPLAVRETAQRLGLGSKALYLAGAAYWILVNSVLEEYVWRWFVVQQSQIIVGRTGAVIFSALAFTAHHAIAISPYFAPAAVILASAGIACGGAIWSFTYIRYRSIWPGYVSHAIVDLALFGIGYKIIFP